MNGKIVFLKGFVGMSAFAPGVIPFAFVCGFGAKDIGMSFIQMMSMSVFIYAGASQLLIMELFANQALLLVIIISALMINLRFTMYSASTAPFLSHLPVWQRAVYAYCLSDQAYGYFIVKSENYSPTLAHYFYIGAASFTWIIWQLSSMAGFMFGALVPEKLNLGFIMPLVFMLFAVMSMKNKSSIMAAFISAVIAIIGHHWPLNLGFIIAVIVGVISGFLLEKYILHDTPQNAQSTKIVDDDC